jgi:DNA-binding protein YbaB
MRKSAFALVTLLLITLMVQPAFAGRVNHRSTKTSVQIPAEWDADFKDDSIVMQDKNDEVEIMLIGVDDAVIKDAVNNVKKALASKIDGLSFGKPSTKKINGMTAITIEGDGKLKGVNVDVAVVVIDAPVRDKDLLVIAVAEDAKLAKHKRNILAVFDSIRPEK